MIIREIAYRLGYNLVNNDFVIPDEIFNCEKSIIKNFLNGFFNGNFLKIYYQGSQI